MVDLITTLIEMKLLKSCNLLILITLVLVSCSNKSNISEINIRKEYYPNGKMKEVVYVEDSLETEIDFSNDGGLRSVMISSRNQNSSPFFTILDNQKLFRQGSYLGQEPHGEVYHFHANGTCSDYRYYLNGDLYYQVEYDQKGYVIDTPEGEALINMNPSEQKLSVNCNDTFYFQFAYPPLTECKLIISYLDINKVQYHTDTLRSKYSLFKGNIDLTDERCNILVLEYDINSSFGFPIESIKYYYSIR